MSNLLKETLEYLPCTISAFSLNNPCSNLSCQLTAGWWISKIIPGRQGNSYRKRYRTFNVKCITSRKQKFDSVLHPCCIQVFLKWNDSHRDPGLFQTHLQHVCSWMICTTLAVKTILTKTPITPPKTKILENRFHALLRGKISGPVTVGGLYSRTKGSITPQPLHTKKVN